MTYLCCLDKEKKHKENGRDTIPDPEMNCSSLACILFAIHQENPQRLFRPRLQSTNNR
jgi:hypothetical protein